MRSYESGVKAAMAAVNIPQDPWKSPLALMLLGGGTLLAAHLMANKLREGLVRDDLDYNLPVPPRPASFT